MESNLFVPEDDMTLADRSWSELLDEWNLGLGTGDARDMLSFLGDSFPGN